MTWVDYGTDRFFYPFVIDSSVNQLVFREDGVDYTFTIEPGVYWSHRVSATTSYQSVLIAIEDKINAQSVTGNYQFQSHTISTDEFSNSSLKLVDTNGSGLKFSWQFQNASFTFNPGYLGFNRNRNITANSAKSTDELLSTMSILGQWLSPKQAAFKTRTNEQRNVFRSDSGPNATINAWTPTEKTRNHKYHKIHAAHIYRYRALDSTEASEAGLTENDTNNTLEDLVEGMKIGAVGFTIYDKGENADALDPYSSTFFRGTFPSSEPNLVEEWQVHPSTPGLSDILGPPDQWEGEHYTVEWPHRIYDDDNNDFPGYDH